jgi:hypothetical protein
MNRFLVLAYGTLAYGAFCIAFVYLIGFAGDFAFPSRSTRGRRGPWARRFS